MHSPEDDTEPKSGNPTKVVVTVNDEACSDLDGITRQLEEAGLAVEQRLDFLGQIVGSWPPADTEPLRRIAGVADVSESRDIQLPAPGSMIQ